MRWNPVILVMANVIEKKTNSIGSRMVGRRCMGTIVPCTEPKPLPPQKKQQQPERNFASILINFADFTVEAINIRDKNLNNGHWSDQRKIKEQLFNLLQSQHILRYARDCRVNGVVDKSWCHYGGSHTFGVRKFLEVFFLRVRVDRASLEVRVTFGDSCVNCLRRAIRFCSVSSKVQLWSSSILRSTLDNISSSWHTIYPSLSSRLKDGLHILVDWKERRVRLIGCDDGTTVRSRRGGPFRAICASSSSVCPSWRTRSRATTSSTWSSASSSGWASPTASEPPRRPRCAFLFYFIFTFLFLRVFCCVTTNRVERHARKGCRFSFFFFLASALSDWSTNFNEIPLAAARHLQPPASSLSRQGIRIFFVDALLNGFNRIKIAFRTTSHRFPTGLWFVTWSSQMFSVFFFQK